MNSFGRIFRISIFGESHSNNIGVCIDGCPPGILINEDDFSEDISRRKPTKNGTTDRIENDSPKIISGVYNNYTTGAPITIIFENNNTKSSDYNFNGFFRPGHADFTANMKYRGYNNPLGGGHFSGRLTLALVTAGVIAKKMLKNLKFESKIITIGGKSNDFEKIVDEAKSEGDSVGGIVECTVKNVPIGLGEPFFDSVESYISHLVFSIPGAKAIEFGEGIKSAVMYGSQFNDVYIDNNGHTKTNNSGGINGGISNGNDIVFRVWFKPSSSIAKAQTTFNFDKNKMDILEIKGRHDACYVLRTQVIVEAVAAIVLTDLFLIHNSFL